MGWDPPKGLKYLYKRVRWDSWHCWLQTVQSKIVSRSSRFGRVDGDIKKHKVFSICNPIGASKPPSYLQRWDGKTFGLEQCRPFEGSLSALAVSECGNFVATGSMFDGTVEIFIAYNLTVKSTNWLFCALGSNRVI